ncbi:MAG: GNAT family protein [Rhodobacterales bacterium]|nr:GNAT family protein [Rhodobacterales bacterium]
MALFGELVERWTIPARPGPDQMEGRHVRLERLDPALHAAQLFAANRANDAIWDYLPYGPFTTESAYRGWAEAMTGLADPFFYVMRDLKSGLCGGVASYLRITPEAGTIEVGHINLSLRMQRTPAATEAMALMMGWAFDAGYRRYEWKCNALNLPSRRAAERLGLSYEGIFRQAAIIKGHNRDTAWFAAIDKEWPALKAAFEHWCDPANFDASGAQKQRLTDLTAPVLVTRDPALA